MSLSFANAVALATWFGDKVIPVTAVVAPNFLARYLDVPKRNK
jgi:hypothetical protein